MTTGGNTVRVGHHHQHSAAPPSTWVRQWREFDLDSWGVLFISSRRLVSTILNPHIGSFPTINSRLDCVSPQRAAWKHFGDEVWSKQTIAMLHKQTTRLLRLMNASSISLPVIWSLLETMSKASQIPIEEPPCQTITYNTDDNSTTTCIAFY